MSQNTTAVVDGTGVEVLAAVNAALDTLNTLHAGATAPTLNLAVNMLWADTANGLLKLCTNTTGPVWVTLGSLATNFGMLPLAGGTLTGDLLMSGKVIEEASAAPASAATLPITGGNFLQPTGTVTITALGTAQAGALRSIYFTTALQLTDSANLILPGTNKNITTVAGDVAEFRSLGSGIWLLTNYKRGDGGLTLVGSLDLSSVLNQYLGADIAAAATTNLATATGDTVRVTNSSGATVITALGTLQAGARRLVYFYITGGSVTLTHNATSLYLPGGQNISVTDGDAYEFVSLGSGNWRCTQTQRNSMAARIWTFVTKSASYTITASDYGCYFVSTATTPDTFTLPSAATAGAGFVVGVRNKNTNSAALTITPNGADTVESVATMTVGVGSSYVLICDGVSAWYRMDTGIASATPQSFTQYQAFTSVGSSTFTVPAGAFYIRVSLWSGGGGSSYLTGGTGAFATGIFSVIPGQTYTVTIGDGGLAGTSGSIAGTAGGTSSFGVLLSCTGGVGGAYSGSTPASGGVASGSGTLLNGAAGSSVTLRGGSSAPGLSGGASTALSGVGATGSGGAAGGTNVSVPAAGASVTAPTRESGGGGGVGTSGNPSSSGGVPGASGGSNNSTYVGGPGAKGECIVEW